MSAYLNRTMEAPRFKSIEVGNPTRVVAVSRDRAGMQDFFAEQGLTYLERPQFHNGRARRAADLIAKRYKKLTMMTAGSGERYWQTIAELKSASENAHPMMVSGAIADICVCRLDDSIGYGAFARMAISGGMFMGSYTGVMVERDDFDGNGAYAFESNPWHEFFGSHFPQPHPHPRLLIDSRDAGNELRFINHIDENRLVHSAFRDERGELVSAANVCVATFFLEGAFHTVIAATRDIAVGEELRFDYGEDYWLLRDCQPDCSTVYRIMDGRLAEIPTKVPPRHHKRSRELSVRC